MVNIGCILPLYSCYGNKIYVGSTKIEKLEAVGAPANKDWLESVVMCKKASCIVQGLSKMKNWREAPRVS